MVDIIKLLTKTAVKAFTNLVKDLKGAQLDLTKELFGVSTRKELQCAVIIQLIKTGKSIQIPKEILKGVIDLGNGIRKLLGKGSIYKKCPAIKKEF